MRRLRLVSLFLVALSSSAFAQTDSGPASVRSKQEQLSHYANLPLSFEANIGQTDGRVKFLSRLDGFSLFLTDDEAVVVVKKADRGGTDAPKQVAGPTRKSNPHESMIDDTIRMKLVGANAISRVVGRDELPGKVNYFIGNDRSKWRSNVPTYAKVEYQAVYPGINLVYYGNQGQVEYDFVVAPGADPGSIGLRFHSRNEVRIEGNGDLSFLAQGVRFQKPRVFQESGGTPRSVDGRYDLSADNTVRFVVGDYDHSKPLIIDPVLEYSTYFGGSGGDLGTGIAVDASGNAYVTGRTRSSDFPIANAIQSTYPTGSIQGTAFVTKINANGSALVYSTYLGGSIPARDSGNGIAVDASGNVYVAGSTTSSDFPTTVNAIQPTSPSGEAGFVTKINANGSALIYSTYLGGTVGDDCNSIAVDSHGNAYVTGFAGSSDFPTVNALQSTLGTGAQGNAFVSKINANGSAFVYSTYLGGGGVDNIDVGNGIAVDDYGNAYVTGWTQSSSFPTANALQPTQKGVMQNAFVTKINTNGSALVYSTYLGGSNTSDNTPKGPGDQGNGIAVDSSGNAYVVGETSSADFPTEHPLQSTLAGPTDAFVTKINASGSALVYSTFIGGSGFDSAGGVAVDALGNAYISGGLTESTDFPTVNALQPTFGGALPDSFVAEVNASGGALVYSSYLGGNGTDFGGGIALDPLGNVYLIGVTRSTDFPTANPLQPHQPGGSGNGSAFVTKIASTIAGRLNLSGLEFFPGRPCTVGAEHVTCGAHFVGWSGGLGHVPNGWTPFPGDEKALWEANIDYQGDVAFGKTLHLLSGSLVLLLRKQKLISETIIDGTVTWPPSLTGDLGCGEGVAKATVFFESHHSGPASFVGCLHDLPASSVVPPKTWGTFFALKTVLDQNN